MDDSKFLDHLVLQLGRPVLSEYESDFVEIEAKGYKSIDEILEKYDFKFAASLKECLKVVKAVEEGDLFRDGVNYDAIFEYDMKIIERFTELVKKELEKTGLIDGDIHITRFHCRDYYFILLAYKKSLTEKHLKKHVISLDKDAEERSKRKLLIKEMKKKYSDPVKALANAINEYYKPILVDLWGSCITREILNEDDGRFQIDRYAYRNCFLFAFDEPISYDDKNFEDLSLFENSTWRVGYIKSAFHKDLPEQLKKTQSRWLLLDFYDLVCDVVEYNGGVLTADNEVRALKFFKQIKDECNITSIDEILDEEEIKKRFDVFIRFIKERYGKNVIFIRADVKTRFLNYKRESKPLRGYKKETLLKKKEFLNKWQDYFEEHMECHVIDHAEEYRADDLCVSGAFMVHYEKEFYEKGYRELKKIICGK